ncbi:Protein kinase [Phytophthora megakarya]|uniref:non-specific serine/threonine protein kinase n=1 Tax=Phytophthora megakarya TaxID=4795 RepID=A0A225VNW3_9STRA|nr:Protein kinase [Phytophthora megakarya]
MATKDLPTKSRENYKQLAHIGRGAYGDVSVSIELSCLGCPNVDTVLGVSILRCISEVTLLKQLPVHPNIVGFREAFWAQSSDASLVLVLVLEHADDGDLEQYLRSLGDSFIREEEVRRIFIQLLQGVQHLHRHNVVHRDLKSSNVFRFRSGRFVLGDFGTSKELSSTGSEQEIESQRLTSTVVGSPLYMSPEQLEGEPHGFATDIWSLGCVLYEILSGGKPAFGAPSYPAVVFRITQGEYVPLDVPRVSSEACGLVASMLQKDPLNRPSITQVLQSPWFQGFNATEVMKEDTQAEVSSNGAGEMESQATHTVPQALNVDDPNISLILPVGTLPPPVPVVSININKNVKGSVSKQNIISPIPAPLHRKSKPPQRQVEHSQHHRKTDQRQDREPSPLIWVCKQSLTLDASFTNLSCLARRGIHSFTGASTNEPRSACTLKPI